MASDSLAQYLREAARYPLLDKSQEILLARQVQTWLHDENATPRQKKAGQRAYEKLIKCNLRLVVSVAKRFSGRIKRSEMLDIVQEGNCGLAHGIKKFDPERGYALSTYVYWWIRQSVSRYLSCSDRVIRLAVTRCRDVGESSCLDSDVPGESWPYADAGGVCGVLQDLAGKDEALHGQRQRQY